MKALFVLIPFLFSLLLGHLLIKLIVPEHRRYPRVMIVSLAWGLGLGINGLLVFTSLLIFNQLHRPFLFGFNLFCLLVLSSLTYVRHKKMPSGSKIGKTSFRFSPKAFFVCLGGTVLLIPLWMEAHFFPFGGWDAWTVWNLKAKFLFLGGEHWKNIFDPVLWRSSPHYPLLLPLINAWGWILGKDPLTFGPMMTSICFTVITVGLLWSTLFYWTKNIFSALVGPLLLTLPFVLKLAIGQYCDLLIGFYLLAAIISLIQSKKDQSPSWCVLGGLFAGLESFTKSEGLVVMGLLALLVPFYLLQKNTSLGRKKMILYFYAGLILTATLPAVFYFFYAPKNITMINGLLTTFRPSSPERFKLIFSFYFMEGISPKWNGLWLLLLAGLILSGKRCVHADVKIIPVLLFFYGLILTLYYYTNTYFDLLWWLQVTLDRILFSLLPLMLLWVFYSLWMEKTED